MSNQPILLLHLEGPLQSWGERSHLIYRDTASFPSKSGVIGLLACALGWQRDDDRIGELSSKLKIAMRADRPGEIMVDYQTVTSSRLLNAEGKRRSNGDTILSWRSYLQDACFIVALSGPKELLEECKTALSNPKWQLYLGRKSCIPVCPIIIDTTNDYSDLNDAMEKFPLCHRHADSILYEIESDGNEGYRRNDVRVVSSERIFSSRFVTVRRFDAKEVSNVLK